MFRARTKATDELAAAQAEIARLRRANDRLVKAESAWIATAASLVVLMGAIEGRFVPPELWTVRADHRTDSATDAVLRQMAARYEDAHERAVKV